MSDPGKITATVGEDGIAEVVIDFPPVNALPVAAWFELAAALVRGRRDPATRVVVLRAEGRGFNAGVDIKEIQRRRASTALIGANRGCFAAFAAVYECAVPVDRRGPRLLPRRRHRPGRQRRRDRRRRRRRPSACPRSTAARSAPPPTSPASSPSTCAGDGVHVGDRDRAELHALRLGARWSPARLREAALAVAAQIAAKDPTVIRPRRSP